MVIAACPDKALIISRFFFLFLRQSQPIFPFGGLFLFILFLVELLKVRRNDWYRQAHHQNSRYGTESPNEFT